jgi:hypothetical protein
LGRLDEALGFLSEPGESRDALDEFAASGIRRAEDVRDVFTRQYFFGCEADDPTNAFAFDTRVNPLSARINAMFASDIGHWDVPDFREVLPEAWELVERGLAGRDRLRQFAFENVVRLFGTNASSSRNRVAEGRRACSAARWAACAVGGAHSSSRARPDPRSRARPQESSRGP